jgi:hypothetical protein
MFYSIYSKFTKSDIIYEESKLIEYSYKINNDAKLDDFPSNGIIYNNKIILNNPINFQNLKVIGLHNYTIDQEHSFNFQF